MDKFNPMTEAEALTVVLVRELRDVVRCVPGTISDEQFKEYAACTANQLATLVSLYDRTQEFLGLEESDPTIPDKCTSAASKYYIQHFENLATIECCYVLCKVAGKKETNPKTAFRILRQVYDRLMHTSLFNSVWKAYILVHTTKEGDKLYLYFPENDEVTVQKGDYGKSSYFLSRGAAVFAAQHFEQMLNENLKEGEEPFQFAIQDVPSGGALQYAKPKYTRIVREAFDIVKAHGEVED